jgi:hypothetical protein
MNEENMQTAIATWAAKNIPARLDVIQTAKLLGFAEHDIQVLMAASKLTPLGDPAVNAPKWFAAIEIIGLATDKDWLHKATKEISKYWKQKRERRVNSHYPVGRKSLRTSTLSGEKVSPNSSPKSSPESPFGSN